MAAPKFKRIHILIADNDVLLTQVITQNLRSLGFSNIKHVRSGNAALQYIEANPVDLLITEWEMPPLDGLQLIKRIRQMESAKRSIPIMMLTGRSEMQDVSIARDVGITEFVIKPFTAKTLYYRIEQIAEHPRGFVLSKGYIGPDRRRKAPPPEETGDRRVSKPVELGSATGSHDASQPAIIAPDHSFKKNMGISGPLSSIITPDVIANAQQVIDLMADESIKWLKEDLTTLRLAHSALSDGPNDELLAKAKEAALSIKSRGGTFGYPLASEVARQLYLFLSTDFNASVSLHLSIFEKHIETTQVIIAQDIKDTGGVGAELVAELRRVISMQK